MAFNINHCILCAHCIMGDSRIDVQTPDTCKLDAMESSKEKGNCESYSPYTLGIREIRDDTLSPKLQQLIPTDVAAQLARIQQKQKVTIEDDDNVLQPAINGNDFMHQTIVEPPWAVPYWVRHTPKLLIAGEEKCGKSKLAYILALSYATGNNFLGDSRFPMEQPGPVMYVDGENDSRTVKTQMIQAALAVGAITPTDVIDEVTVKPECNVFGNIYIYAANKEISLDNEDKMAYIESEIDRIEPVIVFLDSFYCLSGVNVSREEEVSPHIQRFNHWIAKYKCGVGIILHFNKGSTSTGYTNQISVKRISGSKIFADWYSTALLVGNPCAGKELEAEEDGNGDILINKPTGRMQMVVQRLFRGAPRFPDVYMNIDITETSCFVTLGKKPAKGGTEGKKYPKADLPKEVIRFMQDQPTTYERAKENLVKEMKELDEADLLVRDDLRIAIDRMKDDGDLVKGSTASKLRLADKHRHNDDDLKDRLF